MRTNTRTLSAAVFTLTLLIGAAGCGKKPKPSPPPPPTPTAAPSKPVEPPAGAARIVNFSVEPVSIERGQAATLRWSVANSTDISINQGVGAVQANGQRQIFPAGTTTYTLTARSSGGDDTRAVTVTVTAAAAPTPPPPTATPRISGSEMFSREQAAGNLADALFDYDKSDIRADAQQALTRSAATLRQIFAADPTFKVVMEGHADERGSAEYNLGLGVRRATSARDFLVQLGVPANNITTISYGKERPVCTDADEACYQRNRRAHLTPAQ
jgi:peptidoglycan-associated lipoprotein